MARGWLSNQKDHSIRIASTAHRFQAGQYGELRFSVRPDNEIYELELTLKLLTITVVLLTLT